jgi:hypothetical protein
MSKMEVESQVWQFMLVIPAPQGLKWEDHKFEPILGHIERSSFKTKQTKKKVELIGVV